MFWHIIFWNSIIWLTYILTNYLANYYILAFILEFYLEFYLAFYYLSDILSGNTWRGYSRLRSGRERWGAWMVVVVELWQGTLGADPRG